MVRLFALQANCLGSNPSSDEKLAEDKNDKI